MLNLAVRNTAKLVREKSKSENIRLGRLFTKKDVARIMAESFELNSEKSSYTVLDPGAGTGILTAAVVERICKTVKSCRQIFVTCYENNPEFCDMLEDNLERIRKKCRHDYDVRLFVSVYRENYLTESKNHYTVTFFDTVPDKYDLIICSPPTELYEKDSDEALITGGVTQLKVGAPFLFLSQAAKHLEEAGQLVITLPVTYATASGLAPLRLELATKLATKSVHLFVGKQKNLKRAIPLKKNFIVAYSNSKKGDTISISTSKDTGIDVTKLPPLPYDFVVDKESGVFTLPKSVEDTKIVEHISRLPETLTSLGLKMSTGLVIDSKCPGMIFSDSLEGTVPLIRQNAIRNGVIAFPSKIPGQYLAPTKKALMQKNKNMIIIKRIPAKSDARFINSAIYLAAQLPSYKYISTHNKVNFIDTVNKNAEMCPRLAFGLFALLNSTIYDRYLSIVSKSKQINAKELRDLPLPPRNLIENMGMRLMSLRQTSVAACDQIVNPTLHIIEK
jgi:adenine-specific DNA-methyltransferase